MKPATTPPATGNPSPGEPMSTSTTPQAESNSTTATAVATRATLPPARAAGGVIAWDPFVLMDRLDADAFMKEMEGVASEVLVYVIKDGRKEPTYGLSKGGIDECCTMLVSQGQVIREEDLKVSYIGEGDEREAFFQVTASRFAVHPDGREVRMDSVLGVKREALWEARAPLTLDSKVAGKKWRRLSYREAVEHDEAYEYLEWIRDASTFDADTKRFVSLILDGQDVEEFAISKTYNPFWYEHGAMKAARNARSRLIPAGLKAQVVAIAKANATKQKVVERDGDFDEQSSRGVEARAANRGRSSNGGSNGGNGGSAPADQPRSTRATTPAAPADPAEPVVHRRQPGTVPYKYPFAPRRGVPLDALAVDEGTGAVTGYMVSEKLLQRAHSWAQDCLSGKEFQRPGETEKRPLEDGERPKFTIMSAAMVAEMDARRVEGEETAAAEEAKRAQRSVEGEQRADPTAGAGIGTGSPADGSTASSQHFPISSTLPTTTKTHAPGEGDANGRAENDTRSAARADHAGDAANEATDAASGDE